MSEHSALPWKAEGVLVYSLNDFGTNRFSCIVQRGDQNSCLRTTDAECRANAALIVQAVNSHAALVEALQGLRHLVDEDRFIAADAALKLAGVKG